MMMMMITITITIRHLHNFAAWEPEYTANVLGALDDNDDDDNDNDILLGISTTLRPGSPNTLPMFLELLMMMMIMMMILIMMVIFY